MAPVVLSLAALLAAGCRGGGQEADTARSTPPPDRLAVTLRGDGGGSFRIGLDCAVVDRAVCRAVIAALGRSGEDETCAPADDDGRSIAVTGTIGGERVSALLRRRTDCEIRAYDEVLAAVR